MICAVLARVLTAEEMISQMLAMTRTLYVGFGDRPDRSAASVERAARRMRRRMRRAASAGTGAPGGR